MHGLPFGEGRSWQFRLFKNGRAGEGLNWNLPVFNLQEYAALARLNQATCQHHHLVHASVLALEEQAASVGSLEYTVWGMQYAENGSAIGYFTRFMVRTAVIAPAVNR